MTAAPLLEEFLGPDSRRHFKGVLGLLDRFGVAYAVNPRLVRGLDYYSRTVFEWGPQPKKGGKGIGTTLALILPVVVALIGGVGLFFYVPLLLTEWTGVRGGIAFNLVDGVFRLLIFLLYIWGISLWKEMLDSTS